MKKDDKRNVPLTCIFICIILIFFVVFLSKPSIQLIKMNLYNKDCYVKIHKNKIIIYNNKKKVIDTCILGEEIKDYCIGDINGDKLDELVLLTKKKFKKYGEEVIIFSLKGKIKEICREDFSRLNPWKVATGDIDGDGKCEISVGVYKKTPFHKIIAKRPFIYFYENAKLHPKWRGSRLSKPFTDYNFCDIDDDGIDEIISIELLQNKEKVVNTYKWKGFGFEGFLESSSFEDITKLIIKESLPYVQIKDKGQAYCGKVKVKDNNLIIERGNFE